MDDFPIETLTGSSSDEETSNFSKSSTENVNRCQSDFLNQKTNACMKKNDMKNYPSILYGNQNLDSYYKNGKSADVIKQDSAKMEKEYFVTGKRKNIEKINDEESFNWKKNKIDELSNAPMSTNKSVLVSDQYSLNKKQLNLDKSKNMGQNYTNTIFAENESESLGFIKMTGTENNFSGEFYKEKGKNEKQQSPTLLKVKQTYGDSGKDTTMSVAEKLMLKMGHKEGKGLGKHEQGRTTIVESSLQKGRRGFGYQIPAFESSDIVWESKSDIIKAEEDVFWMPKCEKEVLTTDDIKFWLKEGPKKLVIDNETHFCRAAILEEVLKCKSVFDSLEPDEMRRARTKSNPFETIRGAFFLNRAAMKMANIDAVFDFMFTSPKTESGIPMVAKNELLYFADICAGPGGFSEYVLWRKQWDAKGFGFTLKGPNDFKLEDFFAAPSENFEPHYGINGIEGDGDVFVSENLLEFRKFVLASTDDKKVHFVMADGGFSVDGQENIQEILSKQLYVCQFMFALSILREDGHFVCKLFDIFTPFSVGLVYLLYRSFKKVCIHKPNTSRPANSERYIICKWLRKNSEDVFEYLYKINISLNQFSKLSDKDIIEVVPLETLKNDTNFYEYIVNSNETFAKIQANNLAKIKAFVENPNLHEESQSEMRKQCLKYWMIPDKPRSAPSKMNPLHKFEEITNNEDTSYFEKEPCKLQLKEIKSKYDFCCVVVGGTMCFVLGLGRSQIFTWDGKKQSKWVKLSLNLELPKNTLLLAEKLKQLKGEGRAQKKVEAIHVFDAIMLGDKDVRQLSFAERIAQCKKFVKAISKPSRPDYAPLRVKDMFTLESINEVFERLEFKTMKTASREQKLCFRMDDWYFEPSGILFYKVVNKPWSICWSRTHSKFYYYNYEDQISLFKCPEDSISSFRSCFSNLFLWEWEAGVQIHDKQMKRQENKIHKNDIISLVQKLP